MPRGILTKEQKEKQLLAINNPKNCKKLSENCKRMWRTKDMTERNKKVSLSRLGSKHPLWKGDSVGYTSLHQWIKNNFPAPKFCENCHKQKKLEAHNVDGKYKRKKSDWQWLCRKCHMLIDGRLKKLNKFIK